MNCVPFTSERPFLAHEPDGLEPDAAQGGSAVEHVPFDDRVAFTDEREGQMRQWGEVAARAHRAACGHDGKNASVQALDEQLDRLHPRARVALGDGVRPQQQRRSDDVVRIRLAHPAGVAAEQPELELVGELFGDPRRHETPEAGVHAVGVLVAHRLDQVARSAHALLGPVADLGSCAMDGDVPHVSEREILSRQDERRRHAPSLGAPRRRGPT